MSAAPGEIGAEAAQPTPLLSLATRQTFDDGPPLTDEQEQDIQWLRSILLNPTGDVDIRAGAAVRLINMDLRQADAVLVEAIETGEDPFMAAVLEAMQAIREPVDSLLEPAVAALKTAGPDIVDALALAVARYGEPALQRVAALAGDHSLAVSQRLGPVHALGAFRSRSAAIELIKLLDPNRAEPDEIVKAACAALRYGTGLPYGDNPHQWRQWWDQAKDQPREEWMTRMVRRLSEQLALAEQQIQRERGLAQQTEERLAEAYRRLFASLSVEEQLASLPDLLGDPLTSVRGFALDRVARLLRDSVRIDEKLQATIAKRLNDDVSAIRLQAVRLLDQLNYEHAAHRVAERLVNETSPELVSTMLELLARRPSARAVPSVTPWLTDAAMGERAANVIWEVLLAGGDIEEFLPTVRAALRTVLERTASPAHARVLARIGEDSDVESLEPWLDDDDDVMRARVAEGYFHRGHRQPLLDRSHDAVIYPFAVRALARGPADLASFRQLAAMAPSEQMYPLWSDAVQQLAVRLTPDLLVDADELLATISPTYQQLRVTVLDAALEKQEPAIPAETRVALSLRLARLLLDLDQPREAHELLETLNGEREQPLVQRLRFEAAALCGEYDVAAGAIEGPSPWIELLVQVLPTDIELARILHVEIMHRFDGQLDAEQRSVLDLMQQQLSDAITADDSPA